MGPILGGNPYLRYSSAVKITCDGNSLTNGHGDGTPYPTQLAALSPLSGAVTVANLGISGQVTEAMTSSAADVNAEYVAGKTNVLIAWEGINSLNNSDTPRQAADAMWAYIAARLALHPDYLVMLMIAPPRQLGVSEANDIAFNALTDQYNVILKNEWRANGVKFLLDIRQAGSFLNLPDYTRATFAASGAQGWWAPAEVGTNGLTHYSTQGYGAVAQMVATALRRMPRR
jgi:hypothetical protein